MSTNSDQGKLGTVWVVDDSDLVLKLMGRLLADAGVLVRLFDSGELALKLWETMATRAPLLMLIDEDMPRMRGVETVRALRAAGLQCPIFLHTASPTGELRSAGEDAGIDGMLAKPARRSDLEAVIGRCVRVLEAG